MPTNGQVTLIFPKKRIKQPALTKQKRRPKEA